MKAEGKEQGHLVQLQAVKLQRKGNIRKQNRMYLFTLVRLSEI